MENTDVALLIFRVVIGGTLVLHGLNHWRGGGKIAGTASWFESLGLRPGRVHAWSSVLVEIGAGIALAIGLFTPLAAGALIGVMVVAGVIEHRSHGFFVFRNGYEYVLMIAVICVGLSVSGPGEISADAELGLPLWDGVVGSLIAVVIGVGGAVGLLAFAWRPDAPARTPVSSDVAE
ncbi:DoxX family protein [Cryptosporangium aurantiacum]|uniref:Putative oxidoreductase n=1 Tax=Cryptosporangium aurantiacum TaxID=134849 RepID=A0A1M7RK02_9ACTN|nr:DoxX family protein [Cryptosporangium aurantiacum]SHN46594.1 putative oxidoreductase [Cryptosporangium aurantiacum]